MMKAEIERIQGNLRRGRFANEAAVSQGIVLPTLQALGWPVFDTMVVAPEYALEGRRVDYALCEKPDRPKVFVEVKGVGQTDGGDRQLFEYAFHRGVPMAVLTDGQQWSFFLPGEEGKYEERRVYKLDLLERDAAECVERLNRYLDFTRVRSGDALTAARSDYRDAARVREIVATLPNAWRSLVEEQDTLLIDLLADKVEDMCGYKPDPDACSSFLSELSRQAAPTVASVPDRLQSHPDRMQRSKVTSEKAPGRAFVVLEGQTYHARAAREVMLRVFSLLNEQDPGFLDRFAARKHGKKRRYIARDKSELYPGQPDLCNTAADEIVPGWWLGTNYSRQSIEKIIRMACEVAGLRFGRDLRIDLGKPQ